MAQEVFEEHLSVIEALNDNYARKDDAKVVLAVEAAQQEIANLCSSREEDIKRSIRGNSHYAERWWQETG